LESIISFPVFIRFHPCSQRWFFPNILQLPNFAAFPLSQLVVVAPFAGGLHLQPSVKFCSVSPLLQRFAASLRSLAASFEVVYDSMIFIIDLCIY